MSRHRAIYRGSRGQQRVRVVLAGTLALLLGVSLYSVHLSPPAFADQAGCGLGTWDGTECVVSGTVNATGTYNFHHSVRLDGTAHINASNAGITLNIDGAAGLNLTMDSGSVLEADDGVPTPNNPAGPITIHTTGNMTMTDASVDTRNLTQGGAGGVITLDIDGDLSVLGTSQIISSNLGNTDAGDINITVGNYPNTPGTGTFNLSAGSKIEANAGAAGGDITIKVGRTTDIHGDILSQVLSGSTGTGATQGRDGASITIDSGCELTQYDTSTISSRGRDAGADLVHIAGCIVSISGLVESAGAGHGIPNSPANHCADADRPDKDNNSTGCIEVWARDLTITNTAELNADINEGGTGGTTGTSWIDLMASHNITVTGRTGNLDTYVVHADSSSSSDHSPNTVTVKAKNLITATGKAFSADLPDAGSDGGHIIVQAGSDVSLNTAQLLASGDDVQSGGFGNGGQIDVRSFQGSVLWTNGVGDVRPTGADTIPPINVTAPSTGRGVITLTACVSTNTTGTTFPFNGDTATTPGAPTTDCTQAAPTMANYVECCVSTEACNPITTPTPTPTPTDSPSATPSDTPSPTPSDTPSPTPSDTPSPTPSDTPSPTPSDTPSPTPSDTPSPTPSDTPSPTPSDTPSPTPSDTPSPTPSDTPTPTLPQDTPTPTPTETPTPTLPQDTPTPTPTPTPTLPDTGGTPTPTPTLPNTSGPDLGSQTPADPTSNAFLLLLVASVAGLMFMFLPKKQEQRVVQMARKLDD